MQQTKVAVGQNKSTKQIEKIKKIIITFTEQKIKQFRQTDIHISM